MIVKDVKRFYFKKGLTRYISSTSIDQAKLRESMSSARTSSCFLLATLFTCAIVTAQESASILVRISLGDDDRLRLEVPSAADQHHILYHRREADDLQTETPVAMHFGAPGSTILTEPLGIGPPTGFIA